VVVVLVLSGIANLGASVGGPATVVGLFVVLPMALGMAFDYFWQPAPEEVQLPDSLRESGR
jgi:predicted Na+-dependent transporter